MSVLELQSNVMSDDEIRNQTFINGPADGSLLLGLDKEKRLKEPRDLYSTASLQHVPKWPIECQVIPERIRHIENIQTKMEQFYTPNSAELQPKPVGEEMGTVIYNYQPKLSVDYFCRSCTGGAEDLQMFDSEPNTLKFESRFESGNLAKVIKVTNVYYELYLRPDMYTDRHSQWFYFRIQNTKENITYRFSIVNLNKPDSLYRYGLKPLLYSEKEAQLHNHGWSRCGQNISYYKNDIMADENGSFYTLTFNLKFRHANDTVYIAQCYPYTYTKLQNYLASIEADERKSKVCQQRLLCRSLAGNNIYVLTITSPDNYLEENQKKPAIVISARVHPGETQSSYMIKGIIDFLTSNASQAKELRDRFIFKLIPMLNPDGVIVGNSRCCLLGQDLNRQYRTVLREAFPQIYHTKVMLRRLIEENGIFLYCDLHGHSRRNNVFMYGCENKRVPEKKLIEQVFPLMMNKNASDKFSFQNCKFKIQRSKEGTGRVFAWTLGVGLSYTLEISLGGSTLPSRQHTHFNAYDYEAIGRHFCETLLDYSDPNPAKERLREKILQKLLEGGSNADEPVNIPITDYSSLSHSESDPESEDDDGDDDEPNTTTTTDKKLKRSTSVRRQSSTKLPSKKVKPRPSTTTTCLKIERSVMSLSKATVDYVRTGNKYRRLDESSLAMTNDSIGQKIIEVEMEKEPKENSMTRLSKFRRRSKRVNFPKMMNEKQMSNATNYNLLSTKQYTSILFDDPFKPPDVTMTTTSKSSFQFGERDEVGATSATEDECDDCDGAFKNQRYLPDISSLDITEELALLQLSPNTKKLEVPERDPKAEDGNTSTKEAFTSTTTSNFPASSPKPRPKVPTPAQEESVYTKSERKSSRGSLTGVTLGKQKTTRRQNHVQSISVKLDAVTERSNSTKPQQFASFSSRTSLVTSGRISKSREFLQVENSQIMASKSGLAPFTQSQGYLSQRRVSWTGSGSGSGSSNHQGQSQGLTGSSTSIAHVAVGPGSGASSNSSSRRHHVHRGSVTGLISINVINKKEATAHVSAGGHYNHSKRNTLKKSKSMGDKLDEASSSQHHHSHHHSHHHGHSNKDNTNNNNKHNHGANGASGTGSTVKKKKTKLKRTKSRK